MKININIKELVKQHLENGGVIEKIPTGKKGLDDTEKNTMIDKDLPENFKSPNVIFIEELFKII